MFILTYGLQSLQKSWFLIAAGMVTDPGKSFKQFEVGVTELAFSIQHHQTFAFRVTWTLIYWSRYYACFWSMMRAGMVEAEYDDLEEGQKIERKQK